ncbi:MAG TPA: ATP-binding protein [Pyrinomonadaceae bacterium]
MGIRPKIFLIFFAFGILPMLLLIYVNYLNSVDTLEAILRADVERETVGIARYVEARQQEQEAALAALARTTALRAYLRDTKPPASPQPQASPSTSADAIAAGSDVPEDVRETVGTFLLSNRYYSAITCFDAERKVRFRIEPDLRASQVAELHFQTGYLLPSNSNADERVWSAAAVTPLRSSLTREPAGIILRYTVPLFIDAEGSRTPRGALVADMKVDLLFGGLAGILAEFSGAQAQARTLESTLPPRNIVALDTSGNVIYHTNAALQYQPVTRVMPSFKLVADQMQARDSGWAFYDSTGSSWLASYRKVAPLDFSVAVAGNYSMTVAGLRRRGLVSIVLSLLVGSITAIALALVVGRTTRGIERVTQGAVAIAEGRLDQRIEVRSNDETRLLAESFNKMSDKLREQMAREAETRQFQAFLRLSAMMTHDLKNAIAALALIVRNMERRFHHEEYRADAMQSLTLATDKLRALVAKLSGPVESLSGEYKRPRPTDLIPIIERVLSLTATPSASLHQIETRLPASLIAPIDAERIERVVENLVINALEAMGADSGRLTVEAGQTPEGDAFFSVADTGPGMSEEFVRSHLFHAFATTKHKGVGLGLYTCREVVRAHGGRIDVQSQKGSGTCFRVVLPSAPDHRV